MAVSSFFRLLENDSVLTGSRVDVSPLSLFVMSGYPASSYLSWISW